MAEKKNKSKALIAASFAGLMAVTAVMGATTSAFAEGDKCYGVNKCKGTGACGGKGHGCAGMNACKGQGWVKMDAESCVKQGGSLTPAEEAAAE